MAFFSQASADYAKAIQSLVRPTYQSKYGTLIDNQLNKILNKEAFSYDINADPLYQNYKDQYTKMGKEAAMNAAAATSTLTGGYGNSYAGTAAAQANQQYLTQLNEAIPELYNAALNKYNMEKEDMYNQFGLLQSEENRLYGQHRDNISDYYSDLSDLRSGHNTAQAHEEWAEQMEYQKNRDAVSDSQWQKQFDTSNSQWQQEFDTKNAQWEKEYQLALQKAKSSGGSGSRSSKSSSGNNSNYVNSNLSEKDFDLLFKSINNLNDDDTRKMLKDLVNKGYIDKEDANALYLTYQQTDRPVTSTTTPMDMALYLTNIYKNNKK